MKSKRLLLLLLLAIGLPWAAQAQDLADYTFSTGTDDTQWITLSDGLSSIVSSGDDKVSSLTDIGFSFPFGDGTYTKFWANSNGIFSFSSTPATSYNNQFTSSNLSSNQPKICGITRDMCVPSSDGYVKYELTGNAPSRVLVCEFYLGATSSASSATLKWQVQLHEAGSKVVIVYGEAPSSAPSSFQIGLSQSTSDIWTVNPSTHEATHATGAVSNTYSVWPGANRYYQFERPVWTCFKPINLGVSALSTTSATLTWEESGDATNWVLQYGTDSEFNPCTEVNVSNTPSFDATVTAGDTYYFRVKPDCDTDGSKWSNPFEFTAPCEAIAALSFDKGNLDSYTGTSSTPSANNLPDCWSYINNCTYSSYKYYPVIYSSSTYAHSGSNSLRFYSYGYSSYDPQPQYAILPPMDDLAGKQVTLQARGYNASSTFKIGTMSNPMNVNTFHLITEQTGLTTSYQEFEYLIPSTCTDNYLVIMIEAATGYNYNGAYIDDIVIATPPTCIKPSSLDVTADGLDATFSWESDATQWQVAHAMSATANPDDNIVDLVSTKSFTMNDLPLGDHYFWVRTYCSETEQSMWAGPASVHIGYCTPAPTSVDGNGISHVTFGTGDNIVDNDTPKAVYADYSTQIGAVQAGVESTIAITFKTGYTYNTYVWVDLNNDLSFGANEVICYGESTDSNPTTLTLNFTIPATQTLGDFRMRIGSADSGLGSDPTAANPCYTGSYGCFQDYTLHVLEAPSCLVPSNLNLSRNNDQITATWEGTADTYNIDINGTVTNNVTSPYVFTAQLSTTYTVKVQANCPGDETSDWTSSKSITTPDCWNGRTINYTLTDSYNDGWNGGDAIYVMEGCGNLVETLTLSSGSSTSGSLELCGDYYEFRWHVGGNYAYEDSFVFTEGGETIFSGNGDQYEDGEVIYTIGTQSCPTPSDLTAGTAEARSVALTWNENGEATAWQICLNGDEENLIEVVENFTINEGVVSYTLNGLTPDTDYTIKVRANCGEEQSCWSNDDSFSTIVACPVPTNLDVAEEKIEEEKAVLTWVAGGEETAWNIQLATYDDANETWSEYVIIEQEFNKTTYPIMNLTAGTTYRVQVQAVCGGEFNDMSEWSDYFEFTTVATCVAPTNLAVTPDSETAFGATVTWEGTNDSYILEYSKAITPDSEVNTTYDFENGTQGWTTIDADGHGDAWDRYNSSSYAHQGNYSMKATYNGSYAHQDYLVSPQIPLGGTFSFYLQKSGNYTDTFRVYLSQTGNTDASDFSIELTDGDVLPGTSYGDTPYTYDLSNYSGMGYVAIVYTAAANQGWLYVDDVTVTASIEGEYGAWQTVENATSPYTFDELDPESMYKVRVKGVCGSSQSQYSNVVKFTTLEACPAPTNFTLGEVTGNSAAFSWTQPTNGVEINEWVVKYRKSGETEYMTLTPNPTTPSATIENLDANTAYEVVIAPACNEEKTLEDEFDTPCAIHTLPYTYGFEDAAEFDCWTMTNCNNSTGINTSAKRTDNNGFRFYYVDNSQQCLISPEFNCTTEMGVSFYYKNSSTSFDETFHVGYSTTTNDVDAFTWGDEILVDKANTSWLVYTNIFPASTKFVAIKHTSDNAFYLYLDDFTFAEPISLTKEIEPYTGEKDNYYLIASPLAYDVDPTTIEGMTEVDYDLYYFDQTQNLEWRNHKDTEVGGYKLINGKGYLYANNTGNDITFAGVPYVGNGTVTLTKTENAEWSGWNLVGNPFSTTATIERGFYRMNEETGDEIIPGSGEINVMEGVFVEAESNGETMTFTGVVEVNNDQVMAINLNMDNILLDRAMVYFGGERKLSKFQLNPNHTKVYIPMESKDYAVINAESNVGEMPVNFKAEKNGSYNLSFTSQEVSFSYLHLIDNMTGNDVDLLKTPSYTFDATTTDYESRFRLVFATGSSIDGDSFGFINGMGNLCIFGIDGTATVQVVDVTGRMLSSETFSGSYERKLNVAPGVYMIRLINGNDVKVQKMIVR